MGIKGKQKLQAISRKAIVEQQRAETEKIRAEDALNKFLAEKQQREKVQTDELLRVVRTLLNSNNDDMALKRLEAAKNNGNLDIRITEKIQAIQTKNK